MISNTPLSLKWRQESREGNAVYHDTLPLRLQGVTSFAQTLLATDPLKITTDIDSILLLLQRSCLRTDLYEPAVNLINLMHPWPSRLGLLQKWIPHIRFAIDACKQLNRVQDSARFLQHLAQLLYWAGDVDAAQMTNDKAYHLAEGLSETSIMIHSRSLQFYILLNSLALPNEAEQLTVEIEQNQIIQQATTSEKNVVSFYLSMFKAVLSRRRGNILGAVMHAEQALVWANIEDQLSPEATAEAHRLLGLCQWASGDDNKAVTSLKQALDTQMRTRDLVSANLSRSNLGLVYWSMGNLNEAEKLIREAIDFTREVNIIETLASRLGDLGLVSVSRGRLKEALRLVNQHKQVAEQAKNAHETYRAIGNRGLVKLMNGEYKAALQDLGEDLAFMDRQGVTHEGRVNCYIHMGQCYLELGNQAKALDLASQVAQMSDKMGSRSIQIVTRRFLAELKPPSEAVSILYEALSISQTRQLDTAGCLLAIGVYERNPEIWAKGAAILDKIGALYWLSGRSVYDTSPPRLPTLV